MAKKTNQEKLPSLGKESPFDSSEQGAALLQTQVYVMLHPIGSRLDHPAGAPHARACFCPGPPDAPREVAAPVRDSPSTPKSPAAQPIRQPRTV